MNAQNLEVIAVTLDLRLTMLAEDLELLARIGRSAPEDVALDVVVPFRAVAQKLSRLGYRDLQPLRGGAPALVARNGTNEVRLTLTSPGQLTVSSTAAPQFVVPVNTQIWTALAHLWHEAHPWNKEIS